MHASSRGGSSFALIEPLERRELLSFDPAKAGAVWAGSHSWKAETGAPDHFIENQRIGYMIASLNDTLPPTSHAKGGDPWSYVAGGRYQFKNGAGVPIGTLTVRNVQSTHVTVERYWAHDWDERGLRTGAKGKWNGVHTDGIYIENTKGFDPTSVFVFEHVDLTEISGGQGILWEKGSAKRIHFKDVHAANPKTTISGRIMLKVSDETRFDEIIFDDVTANVIFMVNGGRLSDALGTAYVHNLSPSQLDAIRAELSRRGFPVDDPARFVTGLPDDLVDASGAALARPYRGEPLSVGWTTTVQAEEYDNGQEGMAYHDTTADAGGASFRSSAKRNNDAVDIVRTKTGHVVRMVAGEWMDYTIDVRESAVYDVRALTLADSVGGTYRVEFDGIQTTGDVPAGEAGRVWLPKGRHIMRLVAVAGTFDVDGIQLARRNDGVFLSAPSKPSATSIGWGALDTDPAQNGRTFASVTNLSWNDVDGEREYLIQRRTLEGKWQNAGTAAADVTSFSDHGVWEPDGEQTGVQPSTTYEYRVIAVDDDGQRFASAPLRIRTGTPTVTAAPLAPELTFARARASGAVKLVWLDRSQDERGFRIERSTDPSFAASEIIDGRTVHLSYDLPPVGAGVRAYVDRGTGTGTDYAENHLYQLRPGQTYYYRVTAYNSFGQSAPSEVLSVTTQANIRAPAAVREVSVVPDQSGGGGVVVAWASPASGRRSKGGVGGAAIGYRVERRRENSGGSWYVLGMADAGATEFMDLALRTSNIIAYEYRVVAFNAAGDAQASPVASVRVPKSGSVTEAPAKLRTTAFSTTSIELEWIDRSGNEAGFRVERSLDGRNWMLIGVVGADQQTYEDEGLAPRTVYYYRVSAFNTNDTEATDAAARTSGIARGKTVAPKKIKAPNAAQRVKR
jgi:hypothetical protein